MEKGASVRFTDKVFFRSGHCILEEPSRVYVGSKKIFLRIVNGFIARFSDCSYFVLAMALYSLESLNVKVKSTNICKLEMALGVSFTDNLDFSFWP